MINGAITPSTILDAGTHVSASGKRGIVISHSIERDQFGGSIVVHTIHFTSKYSHRAGNKLIYKPIDIKERVNYAAIQVLNFNTL